MAKHSWQYWRGGFLSPIEQCCRKCKLKRRILMISDKRGIQQYKPYKAKDWIRGKDGSLCFDHGGVPKCEPLNDLS